MNYKKLIGYSIDTNQVKITNIKTEKEAKEIVNEIIEIYSDLQLHEIKKLRNTFTSYTYSFKDNLDSAISLHDFLKLD